MRRRGLCPCRINVGSSHAWCEARSRPQSRSATCHIRVAPSSGTYEPPWAHACFLPVVLTRRNSPPGWSHRQQAVRVVRSTRFGWLSGVRSSLTFDAPRFARSTQRGDMRIPVDSRSFAGEPICSTRPVGLTASCAGSSETADSPHCECPGFGHFGCQPPRESSVCAWSSANLPPGPGLLLLSMHSQ